MSEYRNELLTRMIRIYGFEHPLVIQFANSCDCYTSADLAPAWDNVLRQLVECHEEYPLSSLDDSNE